MIRIISQIKTQVKNDETDEEVIVEKSGQVDEKNGEVDEEEEEDNWEFIRPRVRYEIVMLEDVHNLDGYFDYQYYFAYKVFPSAIGVTANLIEYVELDIKMYSLLHPTDKEVKEGTKIAKYVVDVLYPSPEERYCDDYGDYGDDY